MSNLNFPCGICSKDVYSNAVECCLCMHWIHQKCEGLTRKELTKLNKNNNWRCKNCVQVLPFYNISNDELTYLNVYNEQTDSIVFN